MGFGEFREPTLIYFNSSLKRTFGIWKQGSELAESKMK